MIQLAPQFTQRPAVWSDWKARNANKGGQHQFDDDGALYTIWFYDGPEVHLCTIWKGEVPDGVVAGGYTQAQNDADRADFEANYLSTGNALVAPRAGDGAPVVAASAVAYAEQATRFVGKLYTFVPGDTSHDLKVTTPIRLQGGTYWVQGATVGDTVSLSVVDADGIVAPAGTILVQYVKGMPVAPWNHQQEIVAATAGLVPAGMYLRVSYHNIGNSAVSFGVTYRWLE